jgi:hypothetical protein
LAKDHYDPEAWKDWPRRSDDAVCAECCHFMRLRPGHAGICNLKQRGRTWNEGMAVVSESGTCDDFSVVRLTTPIF